MKKVKLLLLPVIMGMLIGCNNTSKPEDNPGDHDDDVVAVTGVTISPKEVELLVGETYTLTATVYPESASNKNVSWASENDNYVSVSNGVITANALGDTYVSVTTTDCNLTDRCHVTVIEEVRTLKGFIHDEHDLLDKVYQYKDGAYSEVTTTGNQNDTTYYVLEYGLSTKIKLKENGYFKPTGITVDGDNYSSNSDNEAIFVAEVDDESDFIDIRVTFKDETPRVGEYQLSLNNSANITLEAYASDKVTPIDSCNINDVIYIKATIKNPDFGVKEIQANTTTSDTGSRSKTVATYVEADDLYSLKTPYSYSKNINIDVLEKNLSLLKDTGLVGNYYTIRTFNVATNNSTVRNVYSSPSILSIEDDGLLTYGSHTCYITSVGNGTVYTDGYDTLVAKDGFVIGCIGNTIDSLYTCDDLFISFKISNPDDTVASYQLHNEIFKVNEETYIVISIYYKDAFYKGCVINCTKKYCLTGVTFEHYLGDYIDDTKAIYSFSDGEQGAVIGYSANGGAYDRCLITNELYGAFSGELGQLVIHSDEKASLGDNSFTYTLAGDKVTLTSTSKEVVLQVNATSKTYTVVSNKDLTVKLPVFAGRKYRSTNGFEDDQHYYSFYLEFSSTEMKLSCVGGCDVNLSMTNCSTQVFAKNVDVEYKYDETAKTVTASLVVKDKSTKTIVFTYHDNDTFTVKTGQFGAGLYSSSATLKRV